MGPGRGGDNVDLGGFLTTNHRRATSADEPLWPLWMNFPDLQQCTRSKERCNALMSFFQVVNGVAARDRRTSFKAECAAASPSAT